MMEIVSVTLEWASNPAVPNGLFILALLTRPATWSRTIVSQIKKRLESSGKNQ